MVVIRLHEIPPHACPPPEGFPSIRRVCVVGKHAHDALWAPSSLTRRPNRTAGHQRSCVGAARHSSSPREHSRCFSVRFNRGGHMTGDASTKDTWGGTNGHRHDTSIPRRVCSETMRFGATLDDPRRRSACVKAPAAVHSVDGYRGRLDEASKRDPTRNSAPGNPKLAGKPQGSTAANGSPCPRWRSSPKRGGPCRPRTR